MAIFIKKIKKKIIIGAFALGFMSIFAVDTFATDHEVTPTNGYNRMWHDEAGNCFPTRSGCLGVTVTG